LEAAFLAAYQFVIFAVATIALRAVLRDFAVWGGGTTTVGVSAVAVNAVVHLALVAWLASPATVFFGALYTEAPFAAVSFLGFVALNRFWRREILPPPTGVAGRAGSASANVNAAGSLGYLAAAIGLFTLAGTIRSNAILLSAHLFHAICAIVVLRTFNHRGACVISRTRAAAWCVLLAAGIVATLTPYVWIIHGAFTSFCSTASAAAVDPLVCGRGVLGFYSGIQSKYWHVGLFTYYTPNNIPNFFLAAPMFLLGFAAVARWFSAAWSRAAVATGGAAGSRGGSPLRQAPSQQLPRTGPTTAPFVDGCLAFVRDAVATPGGAHVFYFLGLLLIALTNMHVQVVTRFVAASSPALYYLWARWVIDAEGARKHGDGPGGVSRAIASYSCIWGCLGVALFSNFMPWT
jgi:phosphatidylinositol glycan class V